jgi:ABC-type amino acid transport substrate-binding protein
MNRIYTIRNVDSLAREGFVVLSYMGNSWSETVLAGAGIQVINANTVEGMYRMLQAKRADIIAEDPILAEPAIRNVGLSESFVLTEGIVEESSFHLMMSARSPYAGWTVKITETLKAMRSDGTIDRIMARYR